MELLVGGVALLVILALWMFAILLSTEVGYSKRLAFLGLVLGFVLGWIGAFVILLLP